MDEQTGQAVGLGLPVMSSGFWGETEFRRLLDKLPTGAYTCDPQGLITYFNQHAVAMWGRTPRLNDPADRFCGSFRLFGSDEPPVPHDQCWMALALYGNKEYNGQEIVVERPSGERFTVLAYANPIREESGKLIGAVNVIVDISDRKRAEESLRQADRHKDEFLATLAHELRNPLAPITSALQILKLDDENKSPDAKFSLQIIDRQVRQMTRLIDDLLDISRITRDRLELRKERINLGDVIATAVETSRPLIETAEHQLEVSIQSESLQIDADATRLAQALSNLLNNAAKYTDPGGHIVLSAQRRGSDAIVTVRDDGQGISPELLPRVFEMFTQGQRLNRVGGGLGIGLTLVKRIVELHGGSIQARSDGPGRGSEFIMRLPIVIDPSQPRERSEKTAANPVSTAPLRILVVDDNTDSVMTLAMLLRLSGHDIRIASDGVQAVDVAERFRPDVALLDLGMPIMNGFDAAKHIREQAWGKSMMLIALTGWGQVGDRERSRSAGFDHHMVKPLDPAALMELLAAADRTRSDSAVTQ